MAQVIGAGRQGGVSISATGAATAWQRYWARQLDLTIAAWVASLALRLVLPAEARFGGSGTGAYLEAIVLLPVAFLIDALVLGRWGRTPGSWLCGIRLVTDAGEPVGLALALRRNRLVYVYGLAFGLPLVSLVTCIHNHNMVAQNRPTSWDLACGTRVENIEGSLQRTWATFGLMMVLSMAETLLTVSW